MVNTKYVQVVAEEGEVKLIENGSVTVVRKVDFDNKRMEQVVELVAAVLTRNGCIPTGQEGGLHRHLIKLQ